MRLLMTTDTVGGVWTYTRELISGLLREGASVLLVSLGRELSADQSAWAADTARTHPEAFRLFPTSYKLEWMEDPWHDVAASRAYVASLVAKYEPDLLHTNQFCFGSLQLPVPAILIAHSDVISWWQAVHGCSPPDSLWLNSYRAVVTEGVRLASCVVAPTQWMLDQVHANYGTPLRSQVIANGCTQPASLPSRPKELRAVTLGRLWDEGKNLAILRNLHSDIPIAVAGEIRPPGSLAAPGGRDDTNDGMDYLGVLDRAEIDALLQASAIYVATSRYEPFGLAPVEAALAGCAIVANDIPPLREVWDDAAIYYNRNDRNALRAALAALASNPASVSHFAQKAKRRATERFLASTMTSGYLDLYRSLIRTPAVAHA
jgi:glycosyltransferase involved in cell wall biosynthesis